MRAGLEAEVGGGARSGAPRLVQGVHLGVRPPGTLVPALAHDPVAGHQHTAHHRVWRRGARTAAGQLQGVLEIQPVGWCQTAAHSGASASSTSRVSSV